MDDNYPSQDDGAQVGDAQDQTTSGDEAGSGGEETTLVPKSFFDTEPKVGDQETIEVVRIHGDEVEVKCVPEDEGSDQPESEPDSDDATMDGAKAQIAAMAHD